MIDYIQKRKIELGTKAESYRESVIQEYTRSSQGTTAYSGIGLIGSGLILAVFLALRYLYQDNVKAGVAEKEVVDNAVKSESKDNHGLRDEFREKLFIVGLEILRQVLLTVVGKLKPLDEKAGVR